MNVVFGINTAKQATKPFAGFEPELYTDDGLKQKADALGICTTDMTEDGAKKLGTTPSPIDRDLLIARIRDYVKHDSVPGNRELHISPYGTLIEAMQEITAPITGIWANHSMSGGRPLWVESDSPGLAALLSEHFATADAEGKKTLLRVGRPDGWVRDF